MICLSKADERSMRHLSYNQSPRPLAAKHTTCQDLNGMANLREHVASDQDEDSGGGTLSSAEANEKRHHVLQPESDGRCFADAGRVLSASSRRMVKAGGDGQSDSSSLHSPVRPAFWGWVTWSASVLIASLALTFIMRILDDKSHIITDPHVNPTTIIESAPEPPIRIQHHQSRDVGKPSCATSGAPSDLYNTPLHVGALFIIWFVSTLSCAFALLAKKFPGLRIPKRFFFVVRHFGTGVLIATAFVHLLPTAFISLSNPCLSDFWTQDYPAIPGAIALAAIFFVTVIEMVFHPARRCTSMPSSVPEPKIKVDEQAIDDSDPPPGNDGRETPMRNMAPPRSRTSSVGHGLNRLPTIADDERSPRITDNIRSEELKLGSDETTLETASVAQLSPEQKLRKERLQCVLLELGILFHSVFIGMSLSVSVGNEFIILLIAIVFHQTFEGLALGSRIAMVKWPQASRRQPWLMALAYGLTTPLGQAIGIATHTLYSPNSEVGLIVVGVMNAISSGLLTFASLVELMSEDFLSDESWKVLRGKKRFVACFLVFLGAFCMSLVGAWA